MEEYFDVLSNIGEYTGEVESRKVCHQKGLWHRLLLLITRKYYCKKEAKAKDYGLIYGM